MMRKNFNLSFNLCKFSISFILLLTFFSVYSITNAQSPRQPLPLQPCELKGIKEKVLCGTYEVFENRKTRRGRKIPLNIVVLPALSSSPASDPLFALAGGPGQAATDGAANDANRFADIRRERDIVLIDQRGTGRSNKLNCDLGNLNEMVQAFVAGEFPLQRFTDCRRELEKRADLRFYTTPIAMDDLDEVRAWLGYKQINLYGGSYGANAAMVYLQRHPKNVRTVTLRAISSLNLLGTAKNSQQTLDRLFEDCIKDEKCAKAFPNLPRDFQAVLNNLSQTPVKVSAKDARNGETVEIQVTRNVFAGAINRLLSDSGAQRNIPFIIQSALKGDFQFIAQLAGQLAGLTDSLSLGMNISITCPEGMNRVLEKHISNSAKDTFQGDGLIRSVFNLCRQWVPIKVASDYFKPVTSKVPVLIFSGTIDPSNPSSEGDKIVAYLPNSLHLKMEGIAHDFPACGYKVLTQFIVSGTNGNLDRSCLNELSRRPFLTPN